MPQLDKYIFFNHVSTLTFFFGFIYFFLRKDVIVNISLLNKFRKNIKSLKFKFYSYNIMFIVRKIYSYYLLNIIKSVTCKLVGFNKDLSIVENNFDEFNSKLINLYTFGSKWMNFSALSFNYYPLYLENSFKNISKKIFINLYLNIKNFRNTFYEKISVLHSLINVISRNSFFFSGSKNLLNY